MNVPSGLLLLALIGGANVYLTKDMDLQLFVFAYIRAA